MKKITAGIVTGFIIGTLSTSVFASTAKQVIAYLCNYQVLVNGQKLNTNGEPIIVYKGRTYVPIRYVAEALGKDVTWDAKNGIAGINDKKPATPNPTPPPISEDSLKSDPHRLTLDMFKKEVQKVNIALDAYNRFEQSGYFVLKSDIDTLPDNSPTRIEYNKHFNSFPQSYSEHSTFVLLICRILRDPSWKNKVEQ